MHYVYHALELGLELVSGQGSMYNKIPLLFENFVLSRVKYSSG